MRTLKGILILLIALGALVWDLYYLVAEPLMMGSNFQFGINQYWAIAVPVGIGSFVFFGTTAWIGFTMARTKEPLRVSYEEGYQTALEDEEQSP